MSKVVDYFLKYVAFDTQSAEDAGTVPSTEKQFALAKLLSEQLKNIGVKDVSMSEHGYVYGKRGLYLPDRRLPRAYGHFTGLSG